MKLNKIALLVAILGFSAVSHAELSKRCEDTLRVSATMFGVYDFMQAGYSVETVPDAVAEKYIKKEIPTVVQMYELGQDAAKKGLTYDDAEQRAISAARDTDIPGVDPEFKSKLDQAGVDAVMCGFDDALKDL